ncbi:MAG: DNA-binding protein [Dehalococcoidia bacterium]|nr:MAG: DNA-binding protein [Dehalococcoidia bacterium]
MSIEPMYTKEQAAKILRISPKTLLNKLSSREITYIKGRPVQIPESAIKEYLRKRTKRARV